MIKFYFKNMLKSYLFKKGLTVIKSSSSTKGDINSLLSDPLSFIYLNNEFRIHASLNMEQGRSSMFFPLGASCMDPRVKSIQSTLLFKGTEKEKLSHLTNLLKECWPVKPTTKVSERFGLEKFNSTIFQESAIYSIFPWSRDSLNDKKTNAKDAVLKKLKKHDTDFSSNLTINELHKKGFKAHANNYLSILNSVIRTGYNNRWYRSPIEATLLIRNNDCRWVIGGDGNHRVLVLSALGHNEVHGMVTQIIRYEDCKYWPNVRNDLFSVVEAKEIFRRVFDGQVPSIFS